MLVETAIISSDNANSDSFGAALSDAGDVNDDGYADIIIGAHGDNDCDGIGGPEDDEDGDGLTWTEEEQLGTDDCDEDTDGDGIADGNDDDPLVPEVDDSDEGSKSGCVAAPTPPAAWLLLLTGLVAIQRRR